MEQHINKPERTMAMNTQHGLPSAHSRLRVLDAGEKLWVGGNRQ